MHDPRAELLRDHAAIEMLARHLSRAIEGDAEPAALASALEQLVRMVAEHLAVEEEILYSAAMEAQPGADAQEVARVQRDFDRLKIDWGRYTGLWTAAEIAADRAGFIRATRAMLPRLQDRVKLETDLLLLVGIGGSSARAAGHSG
jgi:hypothetical protein